MGMKLIQLGWNELVEDAEPPRYAPQCLICGRFVSASTFTDMGPDITGEYVYRWHCGQCGWNEMS